MSRLHPYPPKMPLGVPVNTVVDGDLPPLRSKRELLDELDKIANQTGSRRVKELMTCLMITPVCCWPDGAGT